MEIFKRTLLSSVALVTIASTQIHAANRTWDGSGSVSWNNTANWSGDQIPTNADNAVFDTKVGVVNTAPVVNGSGTAQAVNFTGTGGWTLGGTGNLRVGSGGINSNSSIGALPNVVSTARVTLDASSSWDVAPGNSLTVSGTVSSSATFGITKTGSGILILSGTNTYTGATTVSAGTFFINGNQTAATGAVNVNAGTLGGIGTIGGATTVADNAILAPGQNSVGKLTFANNLTLSGSNTKVQLTVNGPTTPGVDYDAVALGASSVLTYGGDLVLTIDSLLPNSTVLDLFAFTLADLGTWDSITVAGSGGYSGFFTPNGLGIWTLNSAGQTLTFAEGTGDLTVVPEPGVTALVGLGFASLLLRMRRSRKA